MADVSKIQGYDIKDANARNSIATINTTIGAMDDAIGDLQEDVSGLNERLDYYLQVTPIVTTGTKIATLSIENNDVDLYAPQGGGTSGIQSVTGTNSASCTTDASGNVTVDVSYITTGKASNTTPATRSTVEGMNNTVDAPASHCEGLGNTISANATQCAHAEGSSNTVNGVNGHAEGNGNTVGGSNSHAEGDRNSTTANCAHVGGNNSTAGGVSSFAHGYGTKTTNTGECAVGSYNKSDSLTRFSVGGGNSDNNRSNLFEVTSTGSVMNSGELHTGDDVYVGGQNIYINNASSVQKEISINASNQLCIDSVPISGGGSSTHTYSTSEQVVGTWIDGKPLYEKTVLVGNVPRNGSTYVSSGISDIDTVVELIGCGAEVADNSAWADYNTLKGFMTIPNMSSSTYFCGIEIDFASGNKIGIELTSGYKRLDNCYAIIRYTKTTS